MYLRLVLSINIIHRNWTFSTAKNISLLPNVVEGCESGSLGWLLAAWWLVAGAIYPDGATPQLWQ